MKSAAEKRNGKQMFAAAVATFFAVGLLPRAPGTWGSLAALPFAWLLWSLPIGVACMLLAALVLLGTWAASTYDAANGGHDTQAIVIDEVLGIFITTAVAEPRLGPWICAFVLFRFFDIAKPGPIRWIDRKVQGGFGVLADDLAAGLLAAASLWFLQSVALV